MLLEEEKQIVRQQVLHFSLDKISSLVNFPSVNKELFVLRPDVEMLTKYYINKAKNLMHF